MSKQLFKRAGNYRHLINIDRLVRKMDPGTGSVTEHWETVAQRRAFIDQVTGSEYFTGYIVVDKENYFIELRYYEDLHKTDRISFFKVSGELIHLDINELIEDREEGRFLRILGVRRDSAGSGINPVIPPPKVITSIIKNSDHNKIFITFDVPVYLNKPLASIFLINRNGQDETAKEIRIDPADSRSLIVTLKNEALENDKFKWTPAKDQISGGTGNVYLPVIEHGVTNEITHGTIPTNPVPTVISSILDINNPKVINVLFDMDMKHTANIKDAITVKVNTNKVQILDAQIQADKRTFKIILQDPIKYGDLITWAYDDTNVSETLQSVNNVEADNQTYSVSNNLTQPVPAPQIKSAVIKEGLPGSVFLGITQPVTIPTLADVKNLFTVDGKHPVIVSVTGSNIELSFNDHFINGKSYTVSYGSGGSSNAPQNSHGIPLKDFLNYSITNNLKAPKPTDIFSDDFSHDTLSTYNIEGSGIVNYDSFNKNLSFDTGSAYKRITKIFGSHAKTSTIEFDLKILKMETNPILMVGLSNKSWSDGFIVKLQTDSEFLATKSSNHVYSVKFNGLSALSVGKHKIKMNIDGLKYSVSDSTTDLVSGTASGTTAVELNTLDLYFMHIHCEIDNLRVY